MESKAPEPPCVLVDEQTLQDIDAMCVDGESRSQVVARAVDTLKTLACMRSRPVGRLRHPHWIAIYHLSDPRSGKVRYIGQTENVHNRLAMHKARAATNVRNGCATEKDRWICELMHLGLEPKITLLERVWGNDAFAAEFHTIRAFLAAGVPLLNRSGTAQPFDP